MFLDLEHDREQAEGMVDSHSAPEAPTDAQPSSAAQGGDEVRCGDRSETVGSFTAVPAEWCSPDNEPPAPPSPTVRRRVLARELKELRRAAGLTHVDIANRLGWQQGKVSKIEGARQAVPVEAVLALSGVCNATHHQRDHLVALAKDAKGKGWWESYNEVLSPEMRTYIGLEAEADHVAVFASETIPDLLQEAVYAESLLAAHAAFGVSGEARDPATPTERRLELLLRRQRSVFDERGIDVAVVVSEAALRRAVHGSTTQLQRVAELAYRPNVVIRVLPFSAGAVPVDAPFSVLGFQESAHPDTVFLPHASGGTYLESGADVDCYRAILEMLEGRSLGPAESTRFLVDLLPRGGGQDDPFGG